MLKHAIQDLIDQGLVDSGHHTVTIDSLPTHDARVVPPPTSGVHSVEFSGDEIFLMGWDGKAPQPIILYTDSDFSGYTSSQKILRPCSAHDTLHSVPRGVWACSQGCLDCYTKWEGSSTSTR